MGRSGPDVAASERGHAIVCYLDLHAHSTDASDDAGGTVEGYLKWIAARRKRGDRVDGIVLTEHRQFDPAVRYDELAERYEVTVLLGAELETDVGHVLVYGLTPALARSFDFAEVALPHRELLAAVRDEGGAAVPAHAGRPRIGLWDHAERRDVAFELVGAVEALNGGSSDEENGRAARLVAEHGLASVGGSDAHFVSAIGRCLTAFERPVTSIEELVEELRAGRVRALTADQARAEAAAEGAVAGAEE
jgi:predicted metal-dependent phosphoesterase TrpH